MGILQHISVIPHLQGWWDPRERRQYSALPYYPDAGWQLVFTAIQHYPE